MIVLIILFTKEPSSPYLESENTERNLRCTKVQFFPFTTMEIEKEEGKASILDPR